MKHANLHEADVIPEFLRHRPSDKPLDHIALARSTYVAQLGHVSDSLKIIDLRMEETDETIVRLRRQQADDRREAEALTMLQRAARRAIADLDGVDP